MVLGWHDWKTEWHDSSFGPFATDKESCVNMWTDSQALKIPRLEGEIKKKPFETADALAQTWPN